MSRGHEQKHLLYNRSNCCYRDRPQIARPILKSRRGQLLASGGETTKGPGICLLKVTEMFLLFAFRGLDY
jgi:hypothetical protein